MERPNLLETLADLIREYEQEKTTNKEQLLMEQRFIAPTKERQMFEEVSSFYRDLITTKEKGIENLKRSNRMLENKIHKQRKELRRLHEENEDLKEENNTLKEVREFNKGTIELLLDRINGKELSDFSKTITEHTESFIKAMERGSKQ